MSKVAVTRVGCAFLAVVSAVTAFLSAVVASFDPDGETLSTSDSGDTRLAAIGLFSCAIAFLAAAWPRHPRWLFARQVIVGTICVLMLYVAVDAALPSTEPQSQAVSQTKISAIDEPQLVGASFGISWWAWTLSIASVSVAVSATSLILRGRERKSSRDAS